MKEGPGQPPPHDPEAFRAAYGAEFAAVRPVFRRLRPPALYDIIFDHYVCEKQVPGGVVCTCCLPEFHSLFPDRVSLWRDHLFDELETWINGPLAEARHLGLWRQGDDGFSYAKLLTEPPDVAALERDAAREMQIVLLPLAVPGVRT